MKKCVGCRTEFPETSEYFNTKPLPTGGLTKKCKTCCEKAVQYHKAWAKKNPTYNEDTKETRRANNKAWRKANKDHDGQVRRDRYRRLKNECLAHYGQGAVTCRCCGEKRPEFLSLDHIEGNGNQHRKETGRGFQYYRWIVTNNFPPMFQILCHNCNQAKGYYGYCPHEREK